MCAELLQLCPNPCDPMDCSLSGSSLSMGISRQECWSGLPFLSPGYLPDPGIEPVSYISSIGRQVLLLVAQMVKPAMQETRLRALGWEDPLGEGMATHSSILAWKIPWTEEPGRLVHGVTKSRTWLSDFTLPLAPPGKPKIRPSL